MPAVVVLTGGGIKGAVAAARYASDSKLIFVHADYGQASARMEANALGGLSAAFASARTLMLSLPHVLEIQRDGEAVGDRRSAGAPLSPDRGERSSRVSGGGDPGISRAPSAPALRGLMPTLLSVAVQCSMRFGASTMVTGLSRFCDATHLGLNHTGTAPDGCHELIHSLNLTVDSLPQAGSKVRMEAPLMELSLPEIIKLAQRFGIPFEQTWTCVQGRPQPCGRCQPCQSRAHAFLESAWVDPLLAAAPNTTAQSRVASRYNGDKRFDRSAF